MTATLSENAIGKAPLILQIAVQDLRRAPWNARKTFDDARLEELKKSIEEHGVQVPAKAKAERSKILARVKAEKEFRAAVFKSVIQAPDGVVNKVFDKLVTELAAYAIRRSDSTKEGQLAEASGLPEKALKSYSDDYASLRAEISKRPAYVRVAIALAATESSCLTVHEYDVPGASARSGNKKRKTGLEKLAELIGIDVAPLRAGEKKAPNALVKKAAVKESAKKGTK